MGDIEETLDRFIQAFNNLQLDEMVSCYTEDATAFFPVAHHHARLEGREAIRGAFERVLERIKSSGATWMRLDPEDILIKTFGDAAIATFHIRDGDLSRRTLVLRRSDDGWEIEHLHASNAPLVPREEA